MACLWVRGEPTTRERMRRVSTLKPITHQTKFIPSYNFNVCLSKRLIVNLLTEDRFKLYSRSGKIRIFLIYIFLLNCYYIKRTVKLNKACGRKLIEKMLTGEKGQRQTIQPWTENLLKTGPGLKTIDFF
jgi:hypothetical protein